MKTRDVSVGLQAMLLAGLLASPAAAVPVLDFNMDAVHPSGSSVSYAGGSAPVIANDLGVDNVVGIGGTPANNGSILTITGGLLDFTSGANTGGYTWGSGTGCTSLSDASCSITITGGISALSLGAGTVLLAGQVTGVQVTTGNILLTAFINFIDATLAGYYGLPGGTTPWSSVNPINLTILFLPSSGAFNCTPTGNCIPASGDITTSPIPEPGSLMLLGSGLFASAVGLRRRLRRKQA